MTEGESPSERRSNQSTFLREPCVGTREGAGEASAAVRAGRAMERRKIRHLECRGPYLGRRQHWSSRHGEDRPGSTASKNSGTYVCHIPGPGRSSGCPGYGWDRIGKARGRKPMMYGPKKSDTGIVAEKPANKAVRAVAELVEPRPVTNGNSHGQSTDRTQCREFCVPGGRADTAVQWAGPRSLPEVGAVCVSAHVRICAGGVGQPAFLPRISLGLEGRQGAAMRPRAARCRPIGGECRP